MAIQDWDKPDEMREDKNLLWAGHTSSFIRQRLAAGDGEASA